MRTRSWAFSWLAVLAVLPVVTSAQHERFGRVHFPISCKSEVRPVFTRGLALLHSFAYEEAAKVFTEVAAKDPSCGMAQWGIAMSFFHTIWAPPTETELAAGQAAAEKAALIGSPSARERAYISAIAAFYRGNGIPYPTRVATYEGAMAQVAQRNPDDHEALIFHALSILGVAYNSPPDKTYARQKRAAEILNRLLLLEPEHPGIAHYMIHSFDYPALAKLALSAARAYAKIAPSAPHALHMPSHIFTRLGMWEESIKSNLASAKSAQQWVAKTRPGATAFDTLHAWDYLEYAYLQTGQNAKASELVKQVAQVSSLDDPQFAAGFALSAIPARHALERRDWKTAANLKIHPESFPWAKYPYAEANVHFARALGAARSGDLDTARAALTQLTALQSGLQGQKGFDWATQVEIQRRSAAGWLARAEKKDDEALKLLRSAADLEDNSDKHPVTPGSILPAREQLADLLNELGQSIAALTEYEASLRLAPARLNSYKGAILAAERAGQEQKAKAFNRLLLTMTKGFESSRGMGGEAAG